MKRFRPAILGTVSAFTLLAAATASQALVTPVMNLGTLKSQDQWKVGTVDAGKLSYCAMVGKFDKQVVLAVARSPGGMGSVAIDFREKFFEPGASYDVVLTPDSGRKHRLSARASSDRAVVVQVGQDEQFFKDLSAGGDLEVAMPTLNAGFALRGFAGSYKNLLSCTNNLAEASSAAEASPAAGGDDAALAPIDREAADITAGAPVKTAAVVPSKADAFKDMESELEHEAAEEAKVSGKKIAALESRVQGLQSQIAAQKEAAPAPEVVSAPVPVPAAAPEVIAETAPQALVPPRKLIASTQGVGTVSSVTSVSSAADQAEAQAMEQREIERQAASKQSRVAALEAEKAIVAESVVAEAAKKDASLDTKIAVAEVRRDSAREKLQQVPADSEDIPALRARLVAAQSQVAELAQQKDADAAALSQKLSETQTAYEGRLAQLQSERDALRQQLAQTQAAGVQASSAQQSGKVAAAEAKLAEAEGQKSDLAARLDALDRQNKLMQAALSGKEQEVAAAKGASPEAAGLRAQIVSLQKSHADEVASLQKKLDDKAAQYDALQVQLDAAKVAQAGNAGARVALLEQQLQSAQAARQTEADNAAHAQADLAAARQQLAALSESLKSGGVVRAEKTSSLMPSERAELEEYRHRNGVAATVVAAVEPAAVPASVPVPPSPRTVEYSTDLTLPPPVTSPEAVEPSAGVSAVVKVPAPISKPEETAEAAPVSPPVFPGAYSRHAEQGYAVPEQQASADNFPVPAVPAIPVEQQGIAAAASSAGNRAAAFLEKIMTYHRHGAAVAAVKTPPKAEPVAAPTLAAADKIEPPAAPVVRTAAVEIPPPPVISKAPPAAIVQQAAVAAPADAGVLARVETSAGPAAVVSAPKVAAPVAEEKVVEEKAVVAPAPVALESLLHTAGLKDVTMTPVVTKANETVYQWTSGGLNGMFERTAASPEGFGKQANAYLDRYREDCPAQLHVNLGTTHDTPAGHIATASVACDIPGNTYASSFVFLQDGASFAAVLHTAMPSGASEVKNAGDRIAAALASSGIVSTDGLPEATAVATAVPAVQLPEIQPAAGAVETISLGAPTADGTSYAANDDEFQTRIVQ